MINMERGQVRLGAQLRQRRLEGNQRACFLLLLLPELLQSLGSRLMLQDLMIFYSYGQFIQEVASTCCLVKPHAMAWAGAIIEVIDL